jgi:hypothetical protein
VGVTLPSSVFPPPIVTWVVVVRPSPLDGHRRRVKLMAANQPSARVGKPRSVSTLVLAWLGMMSFALVSATVQSGAALAVEDVTAPVLESLSVSPASVDTSGASAEITVTARITDDLSGFSSSSWLYAYFRSPSGDKQFGIGLPGDDLISGTPLDGVYETTRSLPQFSELGTWTLVEVNLRDAAGNRKYWSEAELAAAGYDLSFTQTGAGDVTAPVLESLSLSPLSVDTSGASAELTLTARITDDLSGFSSSSWLYAYFRSPSGDKGPRG